MFLNKLIPIIILKGIQLLQECSNFCFKLAKNVQLIIPVVLLTTQFEVVRLWLLKVESVKQFFSKIVKCELKYTERFIENQISYRKSRFRASARLLWIFGDELILLPLKPPNNKGFIASLVDMKNSVLVLFLNSRTNMGKMLSYWSGCRTNMRGHVIWFITWK